MNKKIDSLGRIVIPAEMRKELKLEDGSMVKVELTKGKIILSNPKKDSNTERAIKYIENSDKYDFSKCELLEILKGEK